MPLDLGNANAINFQLHRAIQRAAEMPDKIIMRVHADEAVKIDDRDVIHLSFTAGDSRTDYWVDVERGAVPRRVRITNKAGIHSQLDYDDLRYVDNIGWFPHRKTLFRPGATSRQVEVVHANFSRPPENSQFRIEFPSPIPVINSVAMIRYAPQKTWDLARLPSPSSPQSRRITIGEPTPAVAAMPGERSPRPSWVIPAIVLGLVLVAVAGRRIYTQRARKF